MVPEQPDSISRAYTSVSTAYAEGLYHELENKPLDRLLLKDLAASVGPCGVVCDLGCGPGHVGAFLRDCAVKVCGVDLSPGMIEEAKRRNPSIPFRLGDMLDLQVENEWGAIAAFYAIVHFDTAQLALACRNLYLALKPGGILLLTFHLGEGGRHIDEFFGVPVSMDFVYFRMADVLNAVTAAGFQIVRVIERAPYEGAEFPSRRGYVLAGRPGT